MTGIAKEAQPKKIKEIVLPTVQSCFDKTLVLPQDFFTGEKICTVAGRKIRIVAGVCTEDTCQAHT